MAHSSSSRLVILAALGGNLLVAATKCVAAYITGSSSMLSEAIHSLIDTGNQALLLVGMRRAARPATLAHPFGYGLELYFWTFVVALLIFGLGAGISFFEGVTHILHPQPMAHVLVNYIVLGLSILFEGSVWVMALRAFRRHGKGRLGWVEAVQRSKDPTVFTVLFEDTAALAGLFVALVGNVLSETLDMPVLDGVSSIIIALILAVTAAFLARESQSLLTGEGVAPEVLAVLRRMALSARGVDRLNEIRSMHFGPRDVLVVISIDFHNDLSAGDVEATVSELERQIKQTYPEVTRVFIEAQDNRSQQPAVIPTAP
ncbi:MAG: cation diffusion facilitator family transporter [Komagataeibacter hansenii]|uniref:Cation diffusion facilitator family transporter n=1 Tax=Novacetimonas hansenii TaxID=436 RepID=A0AAW5ET46_NOVHA|nr:cation diffusion facilitator family transporter [Novacetimonas hansenii]MBL7237443.1 cation diffusion facilitator family transporter [Novacetimonas hansenii]MCJ8354714.1 cation diffusion facilitator family transporter [Novacetimonas hansenii]PYD72192.1 cation transporter [Novacetimonas hansenii]